MTANFDPVARAYRWLEYLSFGPFLSRARFQFVPRLLHARRALVLGDGDGRFVARLLQLNSQVSVDAVDSSARMLRLLERRVRRLGPQAYQRLSVHQADALHFEPPATDYDLVVTHFFLDCFSEREVEILLRAVVPHLAAGALWAISDFAIPPTGPASVFARLVVEFLYRAFHLLTGLRVRRLPQYSALFRDAGFSLLDRRSRLGGLLLSELWQFKPGGNRDRAVRLPPP
jgi:SAM-dependent methyltransferase